MDGGEVKTDGDADGEEEGQQAAMLTVKERSPSPVKGFVRPMHSHRFRSPSSSLSRQCIVGVEDLSFSPLIHTFDSHLDMFFLSSFDLVTNSTCIMAYIEESEVQFDIMVDCTNHFTAKHVFDNKDELLTWVRNIERINGFVIIIRTSDYGGGYKRPRIYLACEWNGKYRLRKKLKDGSKDLLRRAFKLKRNDESTLNVVCGLHNHSTAEHLQGHSYAGRLSANEKLLLVDMSKSLVRPKEILITLKQRDALNMSTMKTVYNVRHQCRVLQKAGRSQMQQLLDELAKHKYVKRHPCEEGSMIVTDLFWAHPVSLDLLRTFPRVLIMDCTYKTNRYQLLFLEIMRVTSTHMTFSVAITYLQIERVDNYVWALQTLLDLMDNSVLPEVIVTDRELALMNAIGNTFLNAWHLLCYWHINKNCLTFLPLRSPPVTLVDRREIAIGFVNGNHFVQVFLEPGHPVPPIAVLWRVHHYPCASE
ncbi:putative protein FAR1-RELATED SEQUENCE 10 [Camellia sinensis]|uniref:putative protein FAR1-RELATED SEQUENCE 10 n=1 Tax=Camellia sinensis TaxID=4442 RepID=UPI001035C04A|nr:putative protein FAR1-RELATED SEQUENCE 10 [Camellia sinensis]